MSTVAPARAPVRGWFERRAFATDPSLGEGNGDRGRTIAR
jgi:hypothetical protein